MKKKLWCRFCGKPFIAKAYNAIFCCRKCEAAHRRAVKKAATPVRLCGVCQTPVTTKGKFCSPKCRAHAEKPAACSACGASLADQGPGTTLCEPCRAEARSRSEGRWIKRAEVSPCGCGHCAECHVFEIMLRDHYRLGGDP
jgi:hypothetical protein